MITYQLDENTNSKKLVESCRKQGLVDVLRWPKRLRGTKDPVGLRDVLHAGRTLLTTDRQIHFEHFLHIPNRHAGILIVAKISMPTTIRVADVMRILSDFKSGFPGWHRASLRNSIVEICESYVEVWKVVHGNLTRDTFLPFDQTGWQEELSSLLDCNAGTDLLSDRP